MRSLTIRNNQGSIQSRSSVFNQYMNDIRHIEKVDEYELCLRIKEGDDKALHQLVTQNLRFVVSVAKQYSQYGVPLMDLIDEGNYGLILAARRFDMDRGFKFISYGVWWVRQSILVHIQKYGDIVRLPLNISNEMTRLNRLIDEKEQDLGFSVNYNELETLFDVDISNSFKEILESAGKKSLSLDITYGEGSDSYSLSDGEILSDSTHQPDLKMDSKDLKESLEKCISTLGYQEQYVINNFFGFGCGKRSFKTMSEDLNKPIGSITKSYQSGIKKIKKIYKSLENIKIPREKRKDLSLDEVRNETYKNYLETIKKPKVFRKPKFEKVRLVRTSIVPIIKEDEEIGPDGYTFNERQILDEMYGAYTGVKSTVGKVASLFKISKLEVISAMKKFKNKKH